MAWYVALPVGVRGCDLDWQKGTARPDTRAAAVMHVTSMRPRRDKLGMGLALRLSPGISALGSNSIFTAIIYLVFLFIFSSPFPSTSLLLTQLGATYLPPLSISSLILCKMDSQPFLLKKTAVPYMKVSLFIWHILCNHVKKSEFKVWCHSNCAESKQQCIDC